MYLYDYLEQNKNNVFEYGGWDCFSFVCNYHETVLDHPIAVDIRGGYTSYRGFYKHLKSLGYANPEAYLDAHFKRIHYRQAKRGDVVLYKTALGLCDGNESVFLNSDGGYITVPTHACKGAWSICLK